MTRVLCVGDIHAMDRPPASVTESYMDDIIVMLLWIADYAAKNKIPTVVWAGDIFNHKQPSRTSHALVLRMIEVVRYYRQRKIELLIVVGNHDISNDVLDSVLDKQPLGVLLKAGAKELNGWHDTLPIFGVPWQQRWLHEDTPWEALSDWRLEGSLVRESVDGMEAYEETNHKDLSKSLVVTHAPIYPPGEAEKQLFDLVPTKGEHGLSAAMGNSGYLYYGHIHEHHGIFEVEGVTYANPGAISRGSLHEYNVERGIFVTLWTEEGFTEIPVPHRPASEVFHIQQQADLKSEKKNLDDFLEEVGSSSLDISSTESVIEHIRGLPVEPRVKAKAIEILEGVE